MEEKMEINNCSYKTKCDMGGCKNLANHNIIRNDKIILSICDECMKELGEIFRKVLVPKCIPAPYKNQKKI